MAPSIRLVILDLDALVESVQLHAQAQALELGEPLLGAVPADDVVLEPRKLTVLLEDATSLVLCRICSSYSQTSHAADSRSAFEAIGWEMKIREDAAPGNVDIDPVQSLANLLDQTFQEAGGACSSHESKTLVLATGCVAPAVLGSIEFFLHAKWRVQVLFLERCWQASLEQLSMKFRNMLELIYIDHYLPDLVVSRQELAALRQSQRGDTAPALANDETSAVEVTNREKLASPTTNQQRQDLQDALSVLRADDAKLDQLQDENAALLSHIRAQEVLLEAERAASQAQIAKREADALAAQRAAFDEREEYLTCPIAYQLYEEPVTVSCCGKTFSQQALEQHRQTRGSKCPWCQSSSYTTLVNRDLAALVELLKKQVAAALEGQSALLSPGTQPTPPSSE